MTHLIVFLFCFNNLWINHPLLVNPLCPSLLHDRRLNRLNTKWNPWWKRELPIHLLSLCIPSGSHNFCIPALPQQSHQPFPWPNQWPTLEQLRIAVGSCFTVLFNLRRSPSAFWWKNPKITYIISLLSWRALRWAKSIWEQEGAIAWSCGVCNKKDVLSGRQMGWSDGVVGMVRAKGYHTKNGFDLVNRS